MSELTVEIWDVTGTKRTMATVPSDVEIEKILVVLVDRLSMPKMAPTGEFMSYKLVHRKRAEQLQDNETLDEQGVESGDVLRLISEITAG
jgi:hypothetical protein